MTGPVLVAPAPVDAVQVARDLSAGVCARHAADVDRAARFPTEAMDEIRAGGLLSAAAPVEHGGLGAGLPVLTAVASELAHGCGATAMIWAMHQIQLACLARHAGGSATIGRLRDGFVADRSLIASGTSERGLGGDLGASRAAVQPGPSSEVRRLEKEAATVSYGADADALLVTARSAPQSAPGDQVAVVILRSQLTLEPLGTWNPLGMRGTCSPGYRLRAEFAPEQILPVPFHEIASATMVPLAHLLWSAVWVGLAEEAFDRAARFAKRRSVGANQAPPPALAEAHWRLSALRAQLDRTVDLLGAFWAAQRMATTSLLAQVNALKVAASETAVEVVRLALRCCGMAGYSEEGPYSVARLLRDALSAPLMISNDRLLATNASLATLGRERAGASYADPADRKP